MFYSYDLLCRLKKGKFSIMWLAANKKKVNKSLCLKVNIAISCDEITDVIMVQQDSSKPRFSLYLSAMLMHGACLIYRQQLIYFMNDLVMFRESLARPKTKMIELPDHLKDRRGRTDDEDSDDETPKKKRVKKTKKAGPSINEMLELKWGKSAEVDVVIEQPINTTLHQIHEADLPDKTNALTGLFGSFDNDLVNKLMEGVSALPGGENLLEEQELPLMLEVVIVNSVENNIPEAPGVSADKVVIVNSVENNIPEAPAISVDKVVARQRDQNDEPAKKKPRMEEKVVDKVVQEMDAYMKGCLSTIDQVIEDVVKGKKVSRKRPDEEKRTTKRKIKKPVFWKLDERTTMSKQERREEARDQTKFQYEHWSELVDFPDPLLKVSIEQMMNQPLIPILAPELQEFYGPSFFLADDYYNSEPPRESRDVSRAERSSIRSTKSTTPQFVRSKKEGLKDDSGRKSLIADESHRSIEKEIPEILYTPIKPVHFPELLSLMEEEVVMEKPTDEPIVPAIEQPMEEEACFKPPPTKKRRSNTSENSQESTSLDSSITRRRESVLTGLQYLWTKHHRVTFQHLCPKRETPRMEAVRNFYALLELQKMRKVRLNQPNTAAYSTINIYPPKSQ